jgi:hypothetical protein
MRFGVESATRTFISSSSFTSRSSLKPAEWRVVQPFSRRRELLLLQPRTALRTLLARELC